MKRQGALSGYRVLDLSDERGMLCSRLLVEMGADVIRIEKPGSSQNRFYWENLGKRALALDIELKPEIFKRLVKTSDALVESFAPGYLEALGLGYPQLSQVNPRLVMASITGFGQSGPYRDYKSCDLVASALGGQLYVSRLRPNRRSSPLATRAIISPRSLAPSASCWHYSSGILRAGVSILTSPCRSASPLPLTMSWCATFTRAK